jgi:hypothetical protein
VPSLLCAVSIATPGFAAAAVVVVAGVLSVGVLAGVEAAVELLLELLPHPASSATDAVAAMPSASGRLTCVLLVGGSWMRAAVSRPAQSTRRACAQILPGGLCRRSA